MMGNPEELAGDEWLTPDAQSDEEMQGLFEAFFYPWLLDRAKYDAWSEAQASRVLCGPLNTMADLLEGRGVPGPGSVRRGGPPRWLEASHIQGRPFMMNASPWSIRRPAPLLGQHTEEVLTGIGYERFRDRVPEKRGSRYEPSSRGRSSHGHDRRVGGSVLHYPACGPGR